jgi:hypothetical protein
MVFGIIPECRSDSSRIQRSASPESPLITHTASGRGFGLTLNFKRATDALVFAASFAVDWTQPVEALQANPEFQRAGNTAVATYGKGFEKDSAKRRLERAA